VKGCVPACAKTILVHTHAFYKKQHWRSSQTRRFLVCLVWREFTQETKGQGLRYVARRHSTLAATQAKNQTGIGG
jgi:hypothetical protein